MPYRNRRGALTLVAVAATILAAASARPAGAASAPSVDAHETFRGAKLHTWQKGQRSLRLRRGADRDGELVTPRSKRRMVVLRRLGAAHRIELRFSFQRRGSGRQTIAVLARNRVTLRIARRGTVLLCATKPSQCRRVGPATRKGKRWNRASLELDVAGRSVRAGLDARRRVRLTRTVRPEREVRVGDARPERGGPMAFDDLRVTAYPAAAAAAAPVAVPAPPVSSARFFAADSVWNTPLPDNVPLDPQSAAITAAFRADIARQITSRTGPWIQTTDHSTPIYTAPASQPRVRVKLDVTAAYGATLQQAFASVPLPEGARPAAGSDGHLTVHQPSTDSLWEFWKLRRLADGWHAAWGGAIQGVSLSPGHYSPSSWPGAGSHWGATATSLPLVAGTMLTSELAAGRIDHALAISVPNARARLFAFPAQRTDGTATDAASIPEGARLRLNPRLNIEALNLPPVVRAMAVAAQRYGMIVRDKTLDATGFFAEDPTPTGTNPYPALFGGRAPNQLLALFPWDHLQLVQMQLARDAG